MTYQDFDRADDEALSAAARSLHEEWDSPDLWPAIADRLREQDRASANVWSRWSLPATWRLAAAAAVLLALSAGTWMIWRTINPARESREAVAANDERLLTDDAVAEIERAEQQYVRAIDELTRIAKPKLEKPDSPLILSLRERLMTIDAAIDEYRMEINKNRFNAHLRQQLLWIYQEKRRTLEEVQESKRDAL